MTEELVIKCGVMNICKVTDLRKLCTFSKIVFLKIYRMNGRIINSIYEYCYSLDQGWGKLFCGRAK
jgi:hypothetical protein